jgi:hypothetical protein
VLRAAIRFKSKPRDGIAHLIRIGKCVDTPESIAAVFHELQDVLDKTMIGDYMGGEKEANIKVHNIALRTGSHGIPWVLKLSMPWYCQAPCPCSCQPCLVWIAVGDVGGVLHVEVLGTAWRNWLCCSRAWLVACDVIRHLVAAACLCCVRCRSCTRTWTRWTSQACPLRTPLGTS